MPEPKPGPKPGPHANPGRSPRPTRALTSREVLVMEGVMAADECLVDDEGEACVGEDERLADARREEMLGALFSEPSLDDD